MIKKKPQITNVRGALCNKKNKKNNTKTNDREISHDLFFLVNLTKHKR